MPIPVALITELLTWGITAFGKGRKLRKVEALLGNAPERAAAFERARNKLDEAQRGGIQCNLSIDEVDALDFVMDMFSKKARKARLALEQQ